MYGHNVSLDLPTVGVQTSMVMRQSFWTSEGLEGLR